MSYDLPGRSHHRHPSHQEFCNGDASSETNHSYTQGQTQTQTQSPFSTFCQHLATLCNTTAARNLLAGHPDHFLTRAIENLRTSVNSIGTDYGRLGPESSWNQPRTNYGPRLSTDFQFPRPHTPNGPSNLNSPHTPPRTPEVGGDGWSKRYSKQISDLEADVAEHKQKLEQWRIEFKNERADHDVTLEELEKSQQAVANGKEIIAEQYDEIKGLRTSVESLTSVLATEYVKIKRFEDAATQYDSLIKLKAKEMRQKEINTDPESLYRAEMAKLGYMQEKARVMLLSSNASALQIIEAKEAIAFVLGRRRELTPDDDLMANDNREAHFLLCNALMRSKNSKQMAQAENMYGRFAPLRGIEYLDDVERIWTLRNAAGLADALARQGYFPDATDQIDKVWRRKSEAPRQFRSQLEKQLLEVVSLLSLQGSKHARKALEIVCEGEPTKHTLRLYTKLGTLYLDNGNYEDAMRILQPTWDRKREMTLDEQRSTAWALARTQGALNKWKEVQPILTELETYDNTQSSPLADELTALRAAMEFNLGHYKDAEATATIIYEKHGVDNVLYPSSMFHHIDTLIRTKTKQKKVEKFDEAKQIWTKVYERRKEEGMDAEGLTVVDPIRGAELQKLCQAAKTLADVWEETRIKEGRRPKSPKEIRDMVSNVEVLLGQKVKR